MQHQAYIAMNPVKAGLVDSPEKYPYCFGSLARRKAAAANTASPEVFGSVQSRG
jgi:hypothetical protein